MEGTKDQQELSLTLKYLLENPALLQPPDSNGNEKGKDDCSFEFQANDLTSAYLGPQIWSDTLLSDDLKLEPVDLDELLDTTGLEDEMGDLSSLMASPKNSQTEMQRHSSNEYLSSVTYQDMPSLMSVRRSPDSNPASTPLPSTYFLYPTPTQFESEQKSGEQCDPNKQKLIEMRLYDQQCAILNDILDKNHFNPSPPQPTLVMTTENNAPAPLNTFQVQVIPSCPQPMSVMQSPPVPSPPVQAHVQSVIMTSHTSKEEKPGVEIQPKASSPISPIEIRIPSPKQVNYVPNTTDMIISTPQDASDGSPFDPSKRAFTEEELKPQPIIRKSKKVHVPDDNKDGKYWSRRNKNNVAAKRSREARRVKENQIAMRANYLEQENSALKTEISELRVELSRVVELVKKYEKRYSSIQN